MHQFFGCVAQSPQLVSSRIRSRTRQVAVTLACWVSGTVVGSKQKPRLNPRIIVSMESITAWLNQSSTQEALRVMLPSVPIALAILVHGVLTRTRRPGNKIVAPTKRSEARIR